MVRKRGSRWHYDFMIRGVRYRGAIPEARTKQQAEEAETKERLKVYERRYGKATGSRNFKEFVEKTYLPWVRSNRRTINDDIIHCNVFCRFFSKRALGEITHEMIERFKTERLHSKTMRKTFRSPASINRELATLSGIFRRAIEYDELEANPCRKVQFLQEKNSRERYLTFEEEAKLIEQLQGCREHLRPIVILALYTGMRRGELLRLRWSKVDFEREIIMVTETKTNRDRTVPMESIVNDVLKELKVWRRHSEDFVFPSHYTGSSFKDISRSFKTACKEAGIQNFRFHDLRHTFASRLVDARVDVVKVKELLGHRSIITTMRYMHTNDQGKRAAITELERYRRERASQDCHKGTSNDLQHGRKLLKAKATA